MADFGGKVVLITGGSSGIGEASAEKFLEAGARVYIVGRNPDRLAGAQEKMKRIASDVFTISANIASVAECEKAVRKVIEQEGKLDILVNCAGVYYVGPSQEMSEETWDSIMDINLKGTFFMCRYALPELEKTGGCIVNVCSDAGILGNAQAAAYCASKGGVALITKTLAVEFAAKGIRVNAVCPGVVETEMIVQNFERSSYTDRKAFDEFYLSVYPQGKSARYTQPEEVAECILFLASTEKVAPVTGALLSVDFGITAGY